LDNTGSRNKLCTAEAALPELFKAFNRQDPSASVEVTKKCHSDRNRALFHSGRWSGEISDVVCQ
ncbi:MAG TPA: hypothetical protein DHM44_02950, partial [Flexistipes sinusarabici]|nr:hypothetical protein [Flexistipes sinusarabici]